MAPAAQFVRQNEILYYQDDDNNYDLQDEKRHAQEVVLGLLAQNQRAQAKIQKKTDRTDHVRFSLIDEPLFWYTLYVADRPVYFHHHHTGGCCSAPSVGRCGNDDGKAVLLALAVAALALAFLVSAGFTVKHGNRARQAHKAANTIRGYETQAQDTKVRGIFARSLQIQERHATSATAKALSTATITVGVGFLTLATALMLYATIQSVPLSPSAHPLLVAGGIFIGGGALAHGGRAVYDRAHLKSDIDALQQLFDETAELGVAHPYHALTNSGHANAYLVLGDSCYVKEGNNYRRQHFADVPRGGYQAVEVPEAAAA